eukprot:scaffold40390_cov26-Tisochrysis_lutea.AAC.6
MRESCSRWRTVSDSSSPLTAAPLWGARAEVLATDGAAPPVAERRPDDVAERTDEAASSAASSSSSPPASASSSTSVSKSAAASNWSSASRGGMPLQKSHSPSSNSMGTRSRGFPESTSLARSSALSCSPGLLEL